jgi:cytochrome c
MDSSPSKYLTPLPASASQAEHGAQLYVLICQDCHGDQGQGLTDAWRATWDPKDQNCWQSKCHAANYPPDGFALPHYVPPVVGPAVVARFATAADLHAFIQQNMPWYAPGSLNENDYWQLTAYLMQANGFSLAGHLLDPASAGQIRLAPATQAVAQTSPVGQTSTLATGLILGSVLVAGLSGLILLWRRRHVGHIEK